MCVVQKCADVVYNKIEIAGGIVAELVEPRWDK